MVGRRRGIVWRLIAVVSVIATAVVTAATPAGAADPSTDGLVVSEYVEGSSFNKAIELYRKSLDESAAAVEADLARARAIEAAEKIQTTRETEEASRRKSVDVTLAEKQAEEKRIAAEAERIRAAVEAEAQKLINEAENVLTDNARHSLFKRKMLEHVEGIIAASVKPMEKIGDIKIMQLDGINGGSGEGRKNPTDEVIDSALRYRVQAPMVDSLMSELGIDGGNLSRMGGLIRDARDRLDVAREAERSAAQSSGGTEGETPAAGGGGDAPKDGSSSSGSPGRARRSSSRAKK